MIYLMKILQLNKTFPDSDFEFNFELETNKVSMKKVLTT